MAKKQITIKANDLKVTMRGNKNYTLVTETNLKSGTKSDAKWYKACAKSCELPHRKGNAHTKGASWDVSVSSVDERSGKTREEYRVKFDTRDEARSFTSDFNAMVKPMTTIKKETKTSEKPTAKKTMAKKSVKKATAKSTKKCSRKTK